MGDYEAVKAQAVPLLIESKKIEGLVAARQYVAANDAFYPLLNKVLELYAAFPHTLATYVVSSHVIQSMTKSAETMVAENEAAPQLPFLINHICFAQSTDFLLSAPENPECANLLLFAALADFFTFTDYFPYIENSSENQDALEYYTSMASVIMVLTKYYKSTIPDSPLMVKAVELCESFKKEGLTFDQYDQTLDSVREAKNYVDSLLGNLIPGA